MPSRLYEFKKIDCIHVVVFTISSESCETFTIILSERTEDSHIERSLVPHMDTCLGFRDEGIFYLEDVGDDCQKIASSCALVYSEAGRRQKALELTERVVEARRRTLGEEHLETLRSMHTLTSRYSEAG